MGGGDLASSAVSLELIGFARLLESPGAPGYWASIC